jgi:uncharacterized membrane protein YphA (DoxX/SURF4 family)
MTPEKIVPGESTAPKPKSFARYLPTIARLLVGLAWFVFGLNGFLNFFPPPKKPMPEGAMAFAGALMKTGYMFPLIAGTQLVVGVLLLLNLFVPLALVLIMPILVNIVAFHIYLEPAGSAPGLVLLALNLYLAWVYRRAYCPMLRIRNKPGEPADCKTAS